MARGLVGGVLLRAHSVMPQDSSTYSGGERRANPRLRELVDEMLATIRAAHHVELWTPQERASCEAEMARIMGSVREHALARNRATRTAIE